jgi:hypothetical protein
LYTPCILGCALHFLIKFSTYLSKKNKIIIFERTFECLIPSPEN